ncbi:MAG: signal peptide peptidase SppA [Thermoguttaceae bacterium]
MSGTSGTPRSDGLYYAVGTSGPSPQQSQQPYMVTPPVVQVVQPPHCPPPSSGGWLLSGCFTLLGTIVAVVVACGVVMLMFAVGLAAIVAAISGSVEFDVATGTRSVPTKFVSGNKEATNKIVVMTVDGVITEDEDGFIAKQIAAIADDETIKGVVLRVDSPGGTMAGSDYYLHKLKQLKASRKIPVVVSMGSVAASGGYYISMVGDEIFAEPSTITGSIGVIAPLFNVAELAKKIGFASTPIVSGALKGMGSITREMTPEERGVWTHLIDESFGRFKAVIREGRPYFSEHPETLDVIADGRIYTATEAVDNKLVDKIGYVDDAIKACLERAGVSSDTAKVVRFKRRNDFFATLTEGRAPSLSTVAEMTTPRLYYLCPQVIPVK